MNRRAKEKGGFMNDGAKESLKAAASGVAGGVAGAGAYSVIGGVGVVAAGTGVGITLGPFIAIGSGLGLVGYGLYRLGKQVGQSKK